MTSWLFDRDAELEPGVFHCTRATDLEDEDTVYVKDVETESVVGPFDHQILSDTSAETSDEGQRILLTPSNETLVEITDQDLLELIDGPLINKNVVNALESALELGGNTIQADGFFDPDGSGSVESDSTASTPKEPEEPSLSDIFIKQKGVERVDFSEQSVQGEKLLEGTTLRGSDLSDTQLKKVTFKNVNLRDVDFRGANLKEATFTGHKTQLAGADFTGATLEGATFEVDVSACIFKDAQLRDANLRLATLEGADFRQARMKRVKLNHTEPERAEFNDAVLQNIKTKGATFEKVTFKRSDLSNTTFVDTEFCAVDFSNADMKEVTFRECTLEEVKFTEAQLSGVTLTDHDTDDLDFERATLKHATFSNSSFDSARFDKARLSNANFVGCDLSGVSLSGVRADGATFERANLEFATLAEADLTDSTFKDSLLYNCQLVSARVDTDTDLQNIHEYTDDNPSTSRGEFKQYPEKKAASVYQTLEAVYRNNSLTSKSLWALRKRKDALLKMNWKRRRTREVVIDGFLKLTTGYGTKPRNLFVFSGIFILISAGVHSRLGTFAYDSPIVESNPHIMIDYGLSVLVSLLAFTGFGYARFSPVTTVGEILTVIQAGAGVLFFGLLVFVFSTRASR